MKRMITRIMTVGILALTMTLAACSGEKKEESRAEANYEEYVGTYLGEKYIDAMSCNISVEITLNEDGTYDYYRAPMVIEMEGGGEMPEITDQGTYEVTGTEITFNGEELGEFTATINMEDRSISGKIPTGGPTTDMELIEDNTQE